MPPSIKPNTAPQLDRAAMMKHIHSVWYADGTPKKTLLAIWAESDGYGEPGYIPCQGYDWSGIRDSSDEAVARMYRAAIGEPVRTRHPHAGRKPSGVLVRPGAGGRS